MEAQSAFGFLPDSIQFSRRILLASHWHLRLNEFDFILALKEAEILVVQDWKFLTSLVSSLFLDISWISFLASEVALRMPLTLLIVIRLHVAVHIITNTCFSSLRLFLLWSELLNILFHFLEHSYKVNLCMLVSWSNDFLFWTSCSWLLCTFLCSFSAFLSFSKFIEEIVTIEVFFQLVDWYFKNISLQAEDEQYPIENTR